MKTILNLWGILKTQANNVKRINSPTNNKLKSLKAQPNAKDTTTEYVKEGEPIATQIKITIEINSLATEKLKI